MANIFEQSCMGNLVAGIDIGSVSINCIVINHKEEILYESPYVRHFGKIDGIIESLFKDLEHRFGNSNFKAIAFTGNYAKQLSREYGAHYEFETVSQVLGALHVEPGTRTIISMGGQETALFQIENSADGFELEYFNTNGPCASGTGSFIDQQAQRLATSVYAAETDISEKQFNTILRDFINLGLQSEAPSNVACRCTVFTKSDMIHLQNKGEKLEDIIYGLHTGNARNYISTIVSNRVIENPVLFVGGLSLNDLQVRAFRKYYPSLIVPQYTASIGALGVALQALELEIENAQGVWAMNLPHGVKILNISHSSPLRLKKTAFPQDNSVSARANLPSQGRISGYLGIDVGSTTTKYVLIDPKRHIIDKEYVHTKGKPVEVVKDLLAVINQKFNRPIHILGVSTTGSGRNVVGEFINADLILDEITAHAKGAVDIDPEIDTVFEIGGQDSKYIYIANGHPLDFDMNKVCAAGTGSFLHELANKYGINIVDEFQKIALSSNSPLKLAERCTVFMESDLVALHQKGFALKDLMAGLCYAVTHNYLNRVVGKRKIGEKVMFLGGPSLNMGVVAAFEKILGRGLLVPKHREVLGAYGAAISVQEVMRAKHKKQSIFRGFENTLKDNMNFNEKICQVDPGCQNQCKLKIYNFSGHKSIWGGECGRYESVGYSGPKEKNYFKLREQIWLKYMAGKFVDLDSTEMDASDGMPTVGMQRSLYTFQTGVLWAHFFSKLGFKLVLTPPTNSRISSLGIETMTAETCYPIKVSHGHIKLLDERTHFLFLPIIIDMPTPQESESGFYCPLVQANAFMVQFALDIDRRKVIDPIIRMNQDPAAMGIELADQLSGKLGRTRKQIITALESSLEMQQAFISEIFTTGGKILEDDKQDKPIVLVTGRPYNLYDERLNLRLGRNLAKIGVRAIPMDFVDVSNIDLSDFPSMYWGLGAQIMRTAKLIESKRHYFGLHITNFSCGADSFLEHFYRHVMGDKPYLILELDEHSAVAGVMTRLEAYKNVIENSMMKRQLISYHERKISN